MDLRERTTVDYAKAQIAVRYAWISMVDEPESEPWTDLPSCLSEPEGTHFSNLSTLPKQK